MKASTFITLIIILITIPTTSIFAQTGTIEGTVYNQNTGKPLEGAEVTISDIDETERTDYEGKVWFTSVPPGEYHLTIIHRSIKIPTITTVEVTEGHTTQVKMYLGNVFELETIVVEGERIPPTVSRKDIRGSELLRIAGVGTDALKGLTTLPSIGIPNDFFGVMYIRGSDPGSNLYYLDRTPLGYPFHWGGLISTISSEIIEKIDIYAGGYGGEFGLDSQAVIDIHARENLEERLNGIFNLNVIYSEGLIESKIGDKGYASISGRRSYFDLIVGPIVESQTGSEQQFPFFSDYQLKLYYPLNQNHELTLNAFEATDHFHFKTQEAQDEVGRQEDSFESSIFFKNGFNGQGIHLSSKFTDKLNSNFSLTRSLNYLDIELDSIFSETTVRNEEGEIISSSTDTFEYLLKVQVPVYTFREDVSYKLTPKIQIVPGFLFAYSPANSNEHSMFPSFEEITDDQTLNELNRTNPENITYDDEGFPQIKTQVTKDYEFGHDLQRYEGYIQTLYDPIPNLSFAAGLRFDYLDVIEQVSIQPRGSVSITLPIGANLRFAYGKYEQRPQLSHLLSQNGNKDLKSSVTSHYIMEIEQEITYQTEFKFATYYKDSQKLITEDQLANYLNQGSGYVGGIELFLRHRVPDTFFGWISYAYTHSERRERPDQLYEPYLFNNTHIVSVVANYTFRPDFDIGAKWQFLSGTSETPLSSIVLIQDPVTRGLNPLFASLDKALSARLTPYHKLDFRVSYKWNFLGMKIGGFLEILNVYKRKNTIEFILEKGSFEVQGEKIEIEEQEIGESGQLPRIPYIGLTIDF